MTSQKNLLEPPRPPDPRLFIRAGTSGVRHLFPIHLDDFDGLFCRSISRLRSHAPSTEFCTNIEMIRNISLTIRTLEHFDVSDNDLESLPLDISLLIRSETLNCSHNQLTNLSDALEELKQLKELDLSFNQFKRCPNVISSFKHLIRFNCEHNLLKNLDSNFVNLKHLKILILDHNQFQSFLTLDFSQLKRLEYLHIAHNQLNKFPLNLHRLTHLKNLNLSHNHLTYFPIELFLINTLDVVNLSHNSIARLSRLTDAYRRTTMIFSIDLSFNQLTKFYDYLLLIALKIDLSNNRIQSIPHQLIRRLDEEVISHRELKIYDNPIVQPVIPMDVLNNSTLNTISSLQLIRSSFDEQYKDEAVRQGFKISIIGSQKSGKSSLAYCLEEHLPLIPEENSERMINIFQFPFYFGVVNHQPSLVTKSTMITAKTPKVKLQYPELDQRKGKKSSNIPPRPVIPISHLPTVPLEPVKSLPVTILDFNGAEEYYQHLSPFIDTHSLHLLCVHTADFHRTTPMDINEVFQDDFDCSTSPILRQLFQILQLLCEKVTDKNSLMILPVATCIDLYDKQPASEKMQAFEKINQFFKLYLQSRSERIQFEIKQIDSLPIISSSLSDRLKTYHSLLNLRISIESCQPISCLSYQGIDELHRSIQHCILTQKTIFPHIDRILPTLWAETNLYIESLADQLPVPYLLWESFTAHIVNQYGLSNLINEITLSLEDQGKILVIHEIGTSDRIVVLRPLWLGDLLSSFFNPEIDHQSGYLHSDEIRSLWNHLLYKKDYFYQILFLLMRFLLIAYPKLSKKQLKHLLNTQNRNEIKFDDIIIPYYLPSIDPHQDRKDFLNRLTNHVSVRYRSSMLPLGFFHRYSVSVLFQFDLIYHKHWNNFIRGEYEEKQVQFLLETDHQTYIDCICGTTVIDRPFDHIWNVLMWIVNHFEEMFRVFAPNNQFHRLIQCPYCNEYSFMGEWMTPKELQGLKLKLCSSCGENVDTNYLVQPNENKRRNEELLRKIRERKVQTTNHLLVHTV